MKSLEVRTALCILSLSDSVKLKLQAAEMSQTTFFSEVEQVIWGALSPAFSFNIQALFPTTFIQKVRVHFHNRDIDS